jgi:hypothetical protein
MANQPRLIIQLPRGGAVDRQLSAQAPQSVASGEVVVEVGTTDAEGDLEPAERNRGDLDDVREEVREQMAFHPAMSIDEVLDGALEPAEHGADVATVS